MGALNAQDVHFSQNNLNPLYLNPALAGIQGNTNVYAGYRTQWARANAPFQTLSASAESPIYFKRKNNPSHLGLGLQFYDDVAGYPKINNTAVNLSLAYHLYVAENTSLSASLYGGYHGLNIEFEEGTWASQHDGWAYNSNYDSGESLIGGTTSAFDVGTGLVFTQNKKNDRVIDYYAPLFQAGIAFYHVNRPNLSMLSDDTYYLPMRFTAFASASIDLGERFALSPQIYIQAQRPFSQVLLGSSLRYTISEKLKSTSLVSEAQTSYFTFGFYHRSNDAIILNALIEYSNYSIGIAFDITTSNLQSVVQSRGATEIMLRYRFPQSKLKAFY